LGTFGQLTNALIVSLFPVAVLLCRVGKYHDIFDIFDIFLKMKISNKLYNNGCNTLMQYLVTISYQSFVPYVKT